MPLKIKQTQAETPNEPQGRDLFQTPNYATDLLIPYIPKNVRYVWECAAGDFKIIKRLAYKGISSLGTDLNGTIAYPPFNFIEDNLDDLKERFHFSFQPDCIITNPPFSLKRKFYEKCLEYNVPFALLIPADYSGWIINAIKNGAEKIIPTRRIDYITPSGLSGATGHTSNFHSMWLTKGFNLGRTETFVELSLKDKENI